MSKQDSHISQPKPEPVTSAVSPHHRMAKGEKFNGTSNPYPNAKTGGTVANNERKQY